jgi:hypothetical protein
MIEITCEFQFNFRTPCGDTLLRSIMITACPFCIRLFSMSVTVSEIISYAATNGPIIHPPNDSLHEYEQSQGVIVLTRESVSTRRKTCPGATLPITSPTWTDRPRTQAFAVRGRRVTAWAMARPCQLSLCDMFLVYESSVKNGRPDSDEIWECGHLHLDQLSFWWLIAMETDRPVMS